MNDPLRCDVCGRFVPFADLDSGAAVRSMVTPDSDYSSEDYETLCRDHVAERIAPVVISKP